ncbi:MAG: two pore domain potassium channel family protein [Desulfuromonadales bacterium]|nr:MAG: two pore domain potassium channel family protein [Desulfuromonadales bacterium]
MFEVDFRYLEQFLIALGLMSLTVLINSVGMNWVRLYYRRFWSREARYRSRRMVMVGIAAIMLAVHCVEVLVWALFFFLRGIVPTWLSAMYYSLASYSTLGESNIALPDHWRGLGGFEAMNAMLMFGWSTAILATVVMKLHSLDE